MKLQELASMVVGKGNETNLTGGPIPNAYSDDSTKVSKKPRKKKKDVWGIGHGSDGAADGGGGE